MNANASPATPGQGASNPDAPCAAPDAPSSGTATRDYAKVGLWMLRGLVIAGVLLVGGQGSLRLHALSEVPAQWVKVLGPHWYATVTTYALVLLALVLAVFSGPVVRASARLWNAVVSRPRPATRADEVVLLLGAMVILFQASVLFQILGGF